MIFVLLQAKLMVSHSAFVVIASLLLRCVAFSKSFKKQLIPTLTRKLAIWVAGLATACFCWTQCWRLKLASQTLTKAVVGNSSRPQCSNTFQRSSRTLSFLPGVIMPWSALLQSTLRATAWFRRRTRRRWVARNGLKSIAFERQTTTWRSMEEEKSIGQMLNKRILRNSFVF